MVDTQPLPSPGLSGRRKGPKPHPKLPLSVFTPPASNASDRFPLAPSPSSVHPKKVIDAAVKDVSSWKSESATAFGTKSDGVVATLQSMNDIEGVPKDVTVLSVSVPLPLEKGERESLHFSASSSPRVHLRTTLSQNSPEHIESIAWALKEGFSVDLQADVVDGSDAGWDILEDVISKSIEPTQGQSQQQKGKIILSNVLPPPHSLELPIVKLLNHPLYNSYQSHIASLSLYSDVYLKLVPPAWGTPTPQAPNPNDLSKEAKEWKRRVKMFLGPAVEAFGYQRIIFGSSPVSSEPSNAGDWYEIARESVAELGLEQEDIDAIFYSNAQSVYGLTTSA